MTQARKSEPEETAAAVWESYTIPCPFCGREELSIKGLFARADNTLPAHLAGVPEACDCPQATAATAANRAANAAAERGADEAKAEQLFRDSGMPLPFKPRTLALWQRATPDQQAAYHAAVNFAKACMARRPASLFIAGDIGTGKTFLASCLARDLIRRGRSVKWANVGDFFREIKRAFMPSNKETEREIIAGYTMPSVLVLDDLGKERPTEWGAEQLFSLVNSRYERQRAVIVTTNYGGDELIRRLTPKAADGGADDTTARAIVDRLREMCVSVILTGESHRTKRTP